MAAGQRLACRGQPFLEFGDDGRALRLADGKTFGRPVGVTVDPRGALLVADDLSNTLWRVTPAQAPAAATTPPPTPSQPAPEKTEL